MEPSSPVENDIRESDCGLLLLIKCHNFETYCVSFAIDMISKLPIRNSSLLTEEMVMRNVLLSRKSAYLAQKVTEKHLPNNSPVEENFTQPLPVNIISMSNDVNCKSRTVSIVNIDCIDGKRVETKVKRIMPLNLMI